MRAGWADRQAAFCMATGVAPSEYKQLARWEIDGFVRVSRGERFDDTERAIAEMMGGGQHGDD